MRIKTNVSKLLNNDLETFYWIGFIYADGWISKNGILGITSAFDDKDHTELFSKYINKSMNIFSEKETIFNINNIKTVHKKQATCHVAVMDKNVIYLIRDKFDIKNDKTYSPPKSEIFEKMTDDQFLAMFTGYIDGDGTIFDRKRKNTQSLLAVRCHKNWLPILEYMENRLYKIFNLNKKSMARISNGQALMLITDNTLLSSIKKKIISYNIPFMERKWGKIDIDFISKRQKFSPNYFKVHDMLKNNFTKYQIAEELKIAHSTVCRMAKRQLQ